MCAKDTQSCHDCQSEPAEGIFGTKNLTDILHGFEIIKIFGRFIKSFLQFPSIRGFPANIQPAEIVKLTFILVLSKQLVWVKEHWGLRSLRSVAFLGGHLLLMVGLYYAISSDMGSALAR